MAENSENSQELANNSEQIEELPVKRGRGRPKGSVDSAPRKRRIVEEPPEPVAPVAPVAPVEPKEPTRMKTQRAAPTPPPPEPPSPRTLLKQAGETIFQLQSQRDSARRDYWAQQINKSLR